MIILIFILLVVAGAFAMFQWGDDVLLRSATPRGHYAAPAPAGDPDYRAESSWLARPGMADDPSGWRPAGDELTDPIASGASLFYLHPTTYLERDRWNAAPVPDEASENRTQTFVRSQASAFNQVAEIWAPRYRQAAFGAFLLRNEDAKRALDLAYRDALKAFDAFLANQPQERPLILAGHSQGALHLSRLLVDRRDALKGRLVAAYVVGWPLSTTADLPAMGRTACTSADETGCILSWQSFGDPANPSLVFDSWIGTKGPTGRIRRHADMVCVNPLTGTSGGSAPPSANLGTLQPSADFSTATIVRGQVGARCDRGLLLVDGALPGANGFVLPGNNYHAFDYSLFWGSIAADAERRVKSWSKTQ